MSTVEELIEEYTREVYIAARSFFVWKAINNLATNDNEIFRGLNTNALSWEIITHSLQVNFFVALGRLFDENPRSLTVRTFISKCTSQIAEFSKPAFEARRLKDTHGVRPEWLDDYLQRVHVPVAADFDALSQLAVRHEATYRTKYKPIRHKVIAHKDFATIGSKDALFANTNIGEVEELLQFLYQVGRVVTELHVNGRKTSLAEHVFDEERYVVEDVEKLLRKLST